VWACLLHGTAPGWFTDDERGWLDDKAAALTWPRHVDRVAEALGDLVAGWVPIHEPDLAARLGYLDGTFPPGRHNEGDHRDARDALRTAEDEAARLLRSGPAPVAVAWRPGESQEGDDLLVVSAPVDGLARPLDQVAEEAGRAGVLVVTGDPDPPADDDARRERLAGAAAEVAAARDGGLAVAGAFHQPAVDGYEWHRGFEARLGLFDRDRNARPALSALPVPPPLPRSPDLPESPGPP
jgi:beta-glucosidase/6-phospho-beta-glucosidase/beta-galactosidase